MYTIYVHLYVYICIFKYNVYIYTCVWNCIITCPLLWLKGSLLCFRCLTAPRHLPSGLRGECSCNYIHAHCAMPRICY